MKFKRFALGILAVACLTVCSGFVQGTMRNRWGYSGGMLAAADKLQNMPDHFKDWTLQSTDKMDDDTRNMLECAGYISRGYANRLTGETAFVRVILGPVGPTSVHTPEICMGSTWYSQVNHRKQVSVGGDAESADAFWSVDFQTKDINKKMINVCYAWSTGGRWSNPESDLHFAFAGRPYLYKIQVSGASQESCLRFLRDFVPFARDYLIEPVND